MRLQDLHTHSVFDDGSATLEQMVRAAVKMGLSAIGLSCHSPIDNEDWTVPASNMLDFLQESARLKEQYREKIRDFCGIEYALCVEVRKDGPDCHLGEDSCFHNRLFEGEEQPGFAYEDLMEMLAGRKESPKEGSYTSYLFEKGLDKILKKVGEECTEVIISAKDNDRANTIYELGDLMYHAMVLMLEMGITLDDIKQEMAGRHVIDRKVKQEKMIP